MDEDFVYHMFMSSLKKNSCSPLIKESTSLFMKEIDQASRNEGDIGSPKSPENVARAFLHSVKNSRGHFIGTPKKMAGISSPSSRRLVPCKIPDVVDAPNGHTSCSFSDNNYAQPWVNATTATTPSFPRSPLLSRCRRKLRLDLKYQPPASNQAFLTTNELQHQLNNYHLVDSSAGGPNRTPELRLSPVVPGRQDDRQHTNNVEGPQPQPQSQQSRRLSLPSVASCSADDKDEHLLIAFNSALLHVRPNNKSPECQHVDSAATAACSKSSAISPVNSVKSEIHHRHSDKHETGTSTEPSPDTTTLASTPATESFHRLHNRLCTSYRVKRWLTTMGRFRTILEAY